MTIERVLSGDKAPIREGLKRMFDDVVTEPVPAPLAALLADIDNKVERGAQAPRG